MCLKHVFCCYFDFRCSKTHKFHHFKVQRTRMHKHDQTLRIGLLMVQSPKVLNLDPSKWSSSVPAILLSTECVWLTATDGSKLMPLGEPPKPDLLASDVHFSVWVEEPSDSNTWNFCELVGFGPNRWNSFWLLNSPAFFGSAMTGLDTPLDTGLWNLVTFDLIIDLPF